MLASPTPHSEASVLFDACAYRVNFWESTAGSDAWALDAFVLTEARDVRDAIEWIERHAHGRRFELFVELDAEPVGAPELPRKTPLVRIIGEDPNDGRSRTIGQFVPY